MKKMIFMAIISAVAVMFNVGCAGISPTVDAKISKDALKTSISTNAKILAVIKEAAKKTNWRITEFKDNEVVAEKIKGDNNTVSSSIKFSNGYIEFENDEADELKDAVEELLASSSKED